MKRQSTCNCVHTCEIVIKSDIHALEYLIMRFEIS